MKPKTTTNKQETPAPVQTPALQTTVPTVAELATIAAPMVASGMNHELAVEQAYSIYRHCEFVLKRDNEQLDALRGFIAECKTPSKGKIGYTFHELLLKLMPTVDNIPERERLFIACEGGSLDEWRNTEFIPQVLPQILRRFQNWNRDRIAKLNSENAKKTRKISQKSSKVKK